MGEAMSTATTSAPCVVAEVPRTPESARVRSYKCIGAALGIDGTTAADWAKKGRLVLERADGKLVPVVYKDHLGFWAPQAFLEEWVRAHESAVGPAQSSRQSG
jgi:hypothetical protein